ncbi:DASH complex, subunit Dad4 [Parasitella parasitica]|nr:DASH complex, subunit Dad4 [Parasitella parasitica]
MENPHEQQQSALLNRIIANLSKLNKSVEELNTTVEKLNQDNNDIVVVADMWNAYNNSVRIHIDNAKDQIGNNS